MGDDMRVLTAIVMRLDGPMRRLLEEMRIATRAPQLEEALRYSAAADLGFIEPCLPPPAQTSPTGRCALALFSCCADIQQAKFPPKLVAKHSRRRVTNKPRRSPYR